MINSQINKVTLISGEGKADRNFLSYLKQLYYTRGSNHIIKIYQNNFPGHSGGSSIDVIKETMKACCNQNRFYDSFVVILDTDICPTTNQAELYLKAKKGLPSSFKQKIPKSFKFIFLDPCLEGLILDIINLNHPLTTSQCKQQLKNIMNFEAHDISENCYRKQLPNELLLERKDMIYSLKLLYEFFNLKSYDEYANWFNN